MFNGQLFEQRVMVSLPTDLSNGEIVTYYDGDLYDGKSESLLPDSPYLLEVGVVKNTNNNNKKKFTVIDGRKNFGPDGLGRYINGANSSSSSSSSSALTSSRRRRTRVNVYYGTKRVNGRVPVRIEPNQLYTMNE
ncbi:MAG: hypothetical protein ACXV2C_00075 [Candidatus Bathyarchaeia archaeon]